MYELYVDKGIEFKCKVHLEGANLKNSIARIILESRDDQNVNLCYNGSIDESGNCSIRIENLSAVLKEHSAGKMKLEVIADGFYFQPWADDFSLSFSKKIQIEQVNISDASNGAHIRVSVPKSRNQIIKNAVQKLQESNITQTNASKHKRKLSKILSTCLEQYNESPERKTIISEIISKI